MDQDEPTRAYDFGARDAQQRDTDELDLGARGGNSPTVAFPAVGPTTSTTDRPRDDVSSWGSGVEDDRTAVFDAPRSTTGDAWNAPAATRPAHTEARATHGSSGADAVMFRPAPEPARELHGAQPRPPGPHAGLRVLAVVLALPLTALGVAGFVSVTTVAIASAVGTFTGDDAVPAWLLPVVAFAAALLLFLTGLTARLSGTGVVVAGVVSFVVGGIALAAPDPVVTFLRDSSVVDALLQTDGVGAALALAVDPVLRLTAGTIGGVSLAVGTLLVAVGVAVHGARRAGWERGAGR
ncbi:hypothetical protein F8O01_06730 [Pseudoclavibacter chungangensis]|uniref:Uncharacterized protein n=1 Tax=Pseudoclavibacter chungangensis TaxID=587635 RepID=A0A7J5BVS8_9MICO|nr:hypothetical protein [Pseudoclavibacter chungangensis]KAB1657963.1 hypothetical protein F8O01_06730 [Pseudoclavibacter chungangensis]NYJ65883.1 hypothetical protein [Pseudoclavibacter chungangensis]